MIQQLGEIIDRDWVMLLTFPSPMFVTSWLQDDLSSSIHHLGIQSREKGKGDGLHKVPCAEIDREVDLTPLSYKGLQFTQGNKTHSVSVKRRMQTGIKEHQNAHEGCCPTPASGPQHHPPSPTHTHSPPTPRPPVWQSCCYWPCPEIMVCTLEVSRSLSTYALKGHCFFCWEDR